MKVCFLLNHFLPYQVAGTEVYTWSLAKSLQEQGHDVSVITPNYDTPNDDEYLYDGLRVARYAEANKRNRQFITGKKAPKGIHAFESLIKKENPDLVNIQELNQSSGVGVYHLKVLNRLQIPVVVTLHLAGYSCYCGTLMYKDKQPCDGLIRIGKCTRCALSRLSLNSVTQEFLYLSSMPLFNLNINTANLNNKAGTAFSYPFTIKNLRERLQQIEAYSSKIIILTEWFKEVLLINGVAENKIQLIKQALPYNSEVANKLPAKSETPLRLMFMGRLHPSKGLGLLLSALDALDENEFLLDIYGEENKSGYVLALKEKCLYKKNISWKGTIAQQHVVNTMQSYSAIIIPSVVCEMAPLLIQEAFAAGVPVIGSNVKGIAEQIHHGENGLLFTMGSAGELKQVIQNVHADRTILKRLSANIQTPRHFKEVNKETVALFESVLNSGKVSA